MALTCRLRYKLETTSAATSTNERDFGSLEIRVEENPTKAAICSVEILLQNFYVGPFSEIRCGGELRRCV